MYSNTFYSCTCKIRLRKGKIIIFLLPDMFYKTFENKKSQALVCLFLNYFIMSLNL